MEGVLFRRGMRGFRWGCGGPVRMPKGTQRESEQIPHLEARGRLMSWASC